ncbi:unnamed protein product [Cylindrotheca closterium]|uniref:Guanylate cyclase n=1 Tax=Cylindrotheca closterium TaxID=2856 RepID=A0AAD2GAL8_9STRA|nr:unnamed protein product [Cylindrotheca closterium]
MAGVGEGAIVDRLRRYGITKMDKKRTVPLERLRNAPLHVRTQVEDVHRWLFVEGGHYEDIESLMTNYCHFVRDNLQIPLDRLYFGGVGLHPKLTSYLWKWELDSFEHREMPQEIFERRNELFSPDEPFCVLEQGRAEFIRIRSSDNYIPPDTEKWFRAGNYADYFALPDIHRGEFEGGLAWSTKHPKGFDDEYVQFFELTQPALSTVIRLHMNALVIKTLTERMEREIEERTSQLATANRELEKASEEISRNAAKQLEHFACMSHEIRTPLNCIVGFSSLMLEKSDQMTAENEESIRMIHENGNLLKCVVDDVLDYAKLESGCFMVNVQPCELHPTISSVVTSIAQKAKKRNVTVRTDYSAELSGIMETDNRRLQQVLFNLLGNAEKFSKDGGVIDFSVSLVGYDEWRYEIERNEQMLCYGEKFDNKEKLRVISFSVKDYGKGIDKKDFETVFEPFSQASKETQSIYGGTGLGLSITSKLVKKLGGFISLDSEPGKFTEFCVYFPFRGGAVDVAGLSKEFTDTTVVLVAKHLGIPISGSNENDSVSISFEVARTYGLDMLRCLDWDDLDAKLSESVSLRSYVAIIADSSDVDYSKYTKAESKIGSSRCALFTCGNTNHTEMYGGFHLGFMSASFPVTVLQRIWSQMLLKKDNTKPRLKLQDSESPSSVVEKKERLLTRKDFQRLQILYADDNGINCKLLHKMISNLGVTNIDLVNDGTKAVEYAECTSYDVIFLDMEMRVMGGIEACQRITEFDPAANIVFVTAHVSEKYFKLAKDAGAKDYITKPFDLKMIRNVLKKSIYRDCMDTSMPLATKQIETSRKATSFSRAQSMPLGLALLSSELKPLASDLKVLYADDNMINQKVLRKVLQRLGVENVDLVDNGQKAVEKANENRYDIIFMDLQMPVMDGLEASKHILEEDPAAVIIVVTAHALHNFIETAAFTGCSDFISKPVNLKKIQSVLEPYTIFDAS